MKIVIVNHNGGSPHHGPNLRTYYAAKSLIGKGHKVSIVSSTYSHKYSKLPPDTNIINPEVIDGINYYWIRIKKYSGLISRIFSHFQFGFRMLRNRSMLPDSADVVLFSGPPPEVFLFSRRLAKHLDAPICCDVRDLWPLTQIQMKKVQLLNPYIWFLYFCESYMYWHSRRIISPLQGMFLYKKKRAFKDKVCVIPNGCNVYEPDEEQGDILLTASFSCSDLGVSKGQQVNLNGLRDRFFIVGYSGSIDRDNDTESIVEAALRTDDPDIIFAIVGDGVMKPALAQRARGARNIVFFDRVFSNQVPQVLSGMDVVYCGLKAKSIYRYGASPAKIYEYMASAKPVIWAVNAYNDPVLDSGCGVSIDPGNTDQIVNSIISLKELPAERLLEMGGLGRVHLEENYSYNVLGNQWETVFRDVVNEKQ